MDSDPKHGAGPLGPPPRIDEGEQSNRFQQFLIGLGLGARQRIGGYEIIRELGKGGMGVVFLAFDPELDRKVALKQMLAAGDEDGHRGLVDEARAMAKLTHPNVLQVYEIIRDDADRPYIVMEYVDGVTLKMWLASRERDIDEILTVFLAAGAGLSAAHLRGLVHRDFKPSNVMCGHDGRVRVMDFGLALPDPGADATVAAGVGGASAWAAGTLEYMAPEQLRGEWADARSDQFSFCVALYEALYGERPFTRSRGKLLATRDHGRLRPCPPHANVPTWLYDIVIRGLRRDPGKRFESMDVLLGAIAARHHDQLEVRYRPASSESPTRARRGGRLGALLGIVVTCMAATSIVQPRMCPTVVDIEACVIRIEGNDRISRGWIVLDHGGEFEIEVDGKLLRFDCVQRDQPVSVVVDLESGGLVYWSNITLTGDDTLRLIDAKPGLPEGVSAELRRELMPTVAMHHGEAPRAEIAHSDSQGSLPGQVSATVSTPIPAKHRSQRPRTGSGTASPSLTTPPPIALPEQPGSDSTDSADTIIASPKLTAARLEGILEGDAIDCGNKFSGTLFATINVRIQIDAGGQAADVDVLGAATASNVAACIVDVIQRTTFPTTAEGRTLTVELPLRRKR